MAETPGRLLSSICLGGDQSNDNGTSSSSSSANQSSNNKLGSNTSCVNVFIHLFDWNRRLSRKGLFFNARRLLEGALDSEESGKRRRTNNNKKKSTPMAKLLLIADEKTRNSTQLHQPSTKSGEIRSLQELLHLDQDDSAPKMLQELLASRHQQEHGGLGSQEALLNLLIQEVKGSQTKLPSRAYPEKAPRVPRNKSKNARCRRAASAATVKVASSGCGGFGKRTSGLFLEAASKILDPRSHPSRQTARALVSSARVSSPSPAHEEEQVEELGEEENAEQPDMFSVRRSISSRSCVMSAPSSPNRNLGEPSRSSCTSIRSLMELFLDDLEEDMDTPTSSSFRHTVSEPSSPTRECEPHEFTRTVTLEPPPPPQKVVPFDELEEHDYISFREFLTGGGRRTPKEQPDTIPVHAGSFDRKEHEIQLPPATTSDTDDFNFMMVHNPLFDDIRSEKPPEDTEDDQGLEEILKSILYQTTCAAKEERVDTSRLTWLPDSTGGSLSSARESYMQYNKDTSVSEQDDSHQMDSDSVEVTSESNCGEDCSQPSPVSVLDSPFDSEVSRKTGKRESPSARKRLHFGDEPVSAPATRPSTSGSGPSSCVARFQQFNVDTLEEAEEYIMMVLEESGVSYHANVTLLVPDCKDGHASNAILSNSVFERLEDRMRVQELIEHLEACSTSSSAEERSNHHSLESLRALYGRYHECRSRRRMVFDFVNEVLSNIVSGGVESYERKVSRTTTRRRRRVTSGRELVEEARRQVVEWKREAFESIDEVVARELSSRVTSKLWRDFHHAEVDDIGMHCEQHIFKSMVEELARDLLA